MSKQSHLSTVECQEPQQHMRFKKPRHTGWDPEEGVRDSFVQYQLFYFNWKKKRFTLYSHLIQKKEKTILEVPEKKRNPYAAGPRLSQAAPHCGKCSLKEGNSTVMKMKLFNCIFQRKTARRTAFSQAIEDAASSRHEGVRRVPMTV